MGFSVPMLPVRAVERQLGPWSDLPGRTLGGLGAQPPRKFFATTPFSLPCSQLKNFEHPLALEIPKRAST